MEISVINSRGVDLGDRIDAEYFRKDNLLLLETLSNRHCKTLGMFGNFVASAFYPAATQLYEIGDTPFIRCVDCINNPIITREQDHSFEKIPFDFVQENKGINLLQKGDIVLTKVGSPCFSSIIHEHELVALSRTVLGIQNIHDIDPYYLVAFLRSSYGFQQLMQQRELTIQYQLTLERVKKIQILEAQKEFQTVIRKVMLKYIKTMDYAKNVYAEAENLLLKELDLKDWQPAQETTTTKKFSDFKASGRFDAEYYQPKYDELFERIKGFDFCCLGKIVNIKKSIEPGSDAYQDTGIPFVRIADVSKFGIIPPGICLERDAFFQEELLPKKNTILLSKDGSVGIAYKLEEDLDAITSGALLHLTVTDDEFLPDYLTLVLNSLIVKMQADRDAGGSIIQHWKPSQIEAVVIPKMPKETQQKISDKVQESFALRKESKRLLELAKRAVEVAIEQGEDVAMKLLENEK